MNWGKKLLFVSLFSGTAWPQSFTDINASIKPLSSGSVAWGDYDGDGDLDLAVCGLDSFSVAKSKIYRNDAGSFTDINAGISSGSLTWLDFDNDGDLDMIISGDDNTKIYKNTGGSFSDAGLAIPAGNSHGTARWGDYDNDGDYDLILTGSPSVIYNYDHGTFNAIADLISVYYGDAQWNDYDRDGDLDLVIGGSIDPSGVGPALTKLYRNDGGIFTSVTTPFTGFTSPSYSWGDFDQDGDDDIIMGGDEDGSGPSTRLFENTGGGFSEVGTGLSNIADGAAVWGDLNNDGKLDLSLAGSGLLNIYRNDGPVFHILTSLPEPLISQRAAWGDYDGDGDLDLIAMGTSGGFPVVRIYRNENSTPNVPPVSSAILTSAQAGRSVTLRWNRATDDSTAQDALTYQLRVGTAHGGQSLIASHAQPNGHRTIPQMGNAGHDTTWTVKEIPDGKYYWSVQAIDHGFAGSSFAAEDSFVIFTQPFIVQPLPDTTLNEDFTKTFIRKLTSVFADSDNTTLTYSVQNTSPNIGALISNDSLYLISVRDSNTTARVIVGVSDGITLVNDTLDLNFIAQPDPPRIIASVPDGSINEDAGKVFILKLASVFKDPDGDALTYGVALDKPARMSALISNDSLYFVTVHDSNGTVRLILSATDPAPSTTRDTFLVTITPFSDEPFLALPLRDTSFAEDFSKTFVTFLPDHFSDIDNTGLNYAVHDITPGVNFVISGDSLYVISTQDFAGISVLSVTADDGEGERSDTLTITVTGVNDPPFVALAAGTVHIPEDAQTVPLLELTNIFGDADLEHLTFTASSGGLLTVSISNDTLYATAAHDSSGAADIYLSASDPALALAHDTLHVLIDPVNDRPFVITRLRDTTFAQNFGKKFIQKLSPLFADIDNTSLTYSAMGFSTGVTPVVSSDSLYVQSTQGFFGSVNIRVIASDGALSASDTFRVSVPDLASPSAFVSALASPLANIVRFVLGADESLSSAQLTVNAQPVSLEKKGLVYFGDYTIEGPGALTVHAAVTDLSSNPDTLQRIYTASLLSRRTLYKSYSFTGSGPGYLIVSPSPALLPGFAETLSSPIEVIATSSGTLHVELDYSGMTEALAGQYTDFDESRIGLYEWSDGDWKYLGGEGRSGIVKFALPKNAILAARYDPNHKSLPADFALEQNYPNPFNPSTMIRYAVAQEGRVSLKIYNLLGQEVRTLFSGSKPVGRYQILWDGKNSTGQAVASGIYMYRLNAPGFSKTNKMTLIK